MAEIIHIGIYFIFYHSYLFNTNIYCMSSVSEISRKSVLGSIDERDVVRFV
jgi:hypothetical protein